MVLIAILSMAAVKNVLAQNREGLYGYEKGANTSGEVRVSNANARSFKFKIGIGSRNPACVGEFSNRADWISTNVAEYRFGMNDSHTCRLIFVFSGNELIVRECDCGNFHGASCSFEATYSSKKK
jgi:hypothetical protein